MKPVLILGAGSWGTAIAIHLAAQGRSVLLWARDKDQRANMLADRRNQRYLPNVVFPDELTVCESLEHGFAQATEVILAVPSHAFAATLASLPKHLTHLAWLTKGIDPSNHELLSSLVQKKFGEQVSFAIISGPSFAREVARHLPTALVIAGNDNHYLLKLRDLFHNDAMRVYLSEDWAGVQICGAVKNVLAIACGMSDGLQYGSNAKAALITRGLAEMRRLGLRLGAASDTFLGLAGVGDLVLTCTDNQSRNRRFGLEIGQGVTPEVAETTIGQVVEGKYNAAQVCALAASYAIDMPICLAVHRILLGELTALQAVDHLMRRPPRHEDD